MECCLCNFGNRPVRSLKVTPGNDPGRLPPNPPITDEERQKRIRAAAQKKRNRERRRQRNRPDDGSTGAGPISELHKSAQAQAIHDSHA